MINLFIDFGNIPHYNLMAWTFYLSLFNTGVIIAWLIYKFLEWRE